MHIIVMVLQGFLLLEISLKLKDRERDFGLASCRQVGHVGPLNDKVVFWD